MSSKQGGKLKPLKQPKADKKDYDERVETDWAVGICSVGALYIYYQLREQVILKQLREQTDLANLQKKKEEEKALKELRTKASQKGALGGAGLKKSGKK